MIVVFHKQGILTVTGHANYAPIGQDVVCAGVSTLLQTFCESVSGLAGDEIKATVEPGNAVVQYSNLSDKGKILLDSFLLGVSMIAGEYPENVKVVNI